MSLYFLSNNVKAAQVPQALPPNPTAKPWGPTNPESPPQEQVFHLKVRGIGTVSATAQIYVSNDSGPDPSQFDWIAYGDPITATGTNNVGQTSAGGTQAWRHFGALITAISGTNAAATLEMSA